MSTYRVIDESELRKPFEEIALIGVPWERFAARFDISFTENDGRFEAPGPMGYAAIELPNGRQFPLEHHFDYQQAGVWVSADSTTTWTSSAPSSPRRWVSRPRSSAWCDEETSGSTRSPVSGHRRRPLSARNSAAGASC